MGTYVGLVSNWFTVRTWRGCSPLTLRGDEVVQPEFAIDLLQPKMDGVVV